MLGPLSNPAANLNSSTASAANAGLQSGMMTPKNWRVTLAPSTRAASVSDFGSVFM